MLEKLFGNNRFKTAGRILEERGGDVGSLLKEVDEAQLEILFSYIEKNLDGEDFQVLHCPLLLNTELGPVSFPLVIGHKNVVYAFLVWPGQWNLDIAREMLALFALFKKRVELKASFVVLSPNQAPSDVAFFALDSPGVRFHLLNLADVGVETLQDNPVKVFLDNFEKSFGRPITPDINGLSVLDKASATMLKPLDSHILYSEPVKATVTLMSAFLQHVLLAFTKSSLSDGRHRKETTPDKSGGPGKVLFFDIDYRGKINHDLLSVGPVRLSGFVRQVGKLLRNPSRMPSKDCFPFFQWILPTVAKPRRDHPEQMRKLLIELNEERRKVLSRNLFSANTRVYRLFHCKSCKEYFSKSVRIKDFSASTLEVFLKKAHFLASSWGSGPPGEEICQKCGKNLAPGALVYLLLCCFLPDLSRDIQYQLDKDADGRFIGSFRAMSKKGDTKYLGHMVNNQSLYSVFKRHFSAVYQWKALFQWVLENGRIDTVSVEDYYHLMAAPPLNEVEKALQLEQMLEPFVMSDREYCQYNLLTVTDAHCFDRTRSFHNWLSEYSQLIVNGSHEAVIFFDQEGYFEKVVEAAEGMGLQYELKAGRILRIIRGEFARDLDLSLLVSRIISEGMLPVEVFYEEAERISRQLESMEKTLELLSRICGKDFQIRFLASDSSIQIKSLDRDESWKLKMDEMADKFSAGAEVFESEIRSLLNLKVYDSNICSCGGKSYITVKLMSKDWLLKASAAESGIVAREKGDAFEVYFTQCDRGHVHTITNQDLKEWRLGFVNLKRRLQQDLPLSIFRVKAFLMLKNGLPVTALSGPDAASISLQPVWVRRAMDKVGHFKADRVNVLAPASNLLLIGSKDASFSLLEETAAEFSRKHSRNVGKPLNCSFSLHLPRQGLGRIQLEGVEKF